MGNSNKKEKPYLLGFPPFKQTFTNKTAIYELNNNYLKPKLAKNDDGKFIVDPETGLNVETDDLDYEALIFREMRDDYQEIQKYAAGLTIAEIIAKYTDSQGNIYIQEASEALQARAKPTLQDQLGLDYVDLSHVKNNIPEMREEVNKVKQELNSIINNEINNNVRNNEEKNISKTGNHQIPKVEKTTEEVRESNQSNNKGEQ